MAFDDDGRNSFEALQQRMNLLNEREIKRASQKVPVAMVALRSTSRKMLVSFVRIVMTELAVTVRLLSCCDVNTRALAAPVRVRS